MPIDTYLKRVRRVIAANGSVKIPGVGELIFVESASSYFTLQADQRMPIQTKSRFKMRMEEFRALEITNPSATDELTVVLWVGRGDIDYTEVVLPQTINSSVAIDLADDGKLEIPGIDSEGRRRKQITVSMRPALANHLQIFDDDPDNGGALLAIIAASSSGGGFAIETDGTLWLKNKTGGAIQSTGATPDVAIMQTFYL